MVIIKIIIARAAAEIIVFAFTRGRRLSVTAQRLLGSCICCVGCETDRAVCWSFYTRTLDISVSELHRIVSFVWSVSNSMSRLASVMC